MGCHEGAAKAAEIRKKRLFAELGVGSTARAHGVAGEHMVRKAAIALRLHGEHMPDAKKAELVEQIRRHTGNADEFGDSELRAVERRIANCSHESEARDDRLARGIIAQCDNIGSFIDGWKLHFVEKLRPAFLPANWMSSIVEATSSLPHAADQRPVRHPGAQYVAHCPQCIIQSTLNGVEPDAH